MCTGMITRSSIGAGMFKTEISGWIDDKYVPRIVTADAGIEMNEMVGSFNFAVSINGEYGYLDLNI